MQNYYKLTPSGFALLHVAECVLPLRSFFAEIAPSAFAHTLFLVEERIGLVLEFADRDERFISVPGQASPFPLPPRQT